MLKVDMDHCYGCSACEQVCGKRAIRLLPNAEGFLYPVVDSAACNNCGLCERVCPISSENLHRVLFDASEHVFAAWNKDISKVKESTSGGIFAVLAEYVIRADGVVYGCSWKDNSLIAAHQRVASLEDLNMLKGSKYVQSNLTDTFSKVKIDLQQGLLVLYSGTPCQIAGLRLFLKKQYEKLLTIDLVCHGVPSPKVFDEYIQWLQQKKRATITSFKFRDKKNNDPRAYVSWIENNGTKKYSLVGMQPYTFGFYNSFFSRESCFNCGFSTNQRCGDITLSDFWGGENHHPELSKARLHGFNLVICNSQQGLKFFQSIKESIIALPSKLEYATAGDSRLRMSDPRPKFRNSSYEILNEKGFAYLARTHLKPKYYWLQSLVPFWVRRLIKKK